MSDILTYTLLMRAKKNIGDFLIFDKAHKLLSFYKKSEEHVVYNAWEPLDDYIDAINDTKAVIICGGPGIKKNFYPGIYPLTKNIDDIKVPIILFGTGWSGLPGTDNDIKNYMFSDSSLNTLKKISSSFNYISCRDYNTVKLLSNNGFTNAIMTGGPAWYDLRYISKPFIIPKTIKKIVFTPAQNEIYYQQTVEIMEMLRTTFPNATLYCSFHRGLNADKYTSKEEAARLERMNKVGLRLGYDIVNAAYDLENIRFYEECDLHVGYRLHGHINFLSLRKPSFLLHEDSRGRGFSEAIGLPGIQAWEHGVLGNRSFIPEKIRKRMVRANIRAPNKLKNYLTEEVGNGFMSFKNLHEEFQKHFETMKRFILEIP
jgi:hypothetical protein